MKRIKNFCRILLTAAVLAAMPLGLGGCPQVAATLLPLLTDIITDFIDAERKLDELDAAADNWFAKYPNEAMQAEWDKAVDRTRGTLDVALNTARGAKELTESDYQAAFADFGRAWQDLIVLARKTGVIGAAGVYGAGPGTAPPEPPVCLGRIKGTGP